MKAAIHFPSPSFLDSVIYDFGNEIDDCFRTLRRYASMMCARDRREEAFEIGFVVGAHSYFLDRRDGYYRMCKHANNRRGAIQYFEKIGEVCDYLRANFKKD